MKRTADRLFGDDYHWSVLGAGRHQLAIAAQAVSMGGNLRVGLEDSLWIGAGQLATSNAEQVGKARSIVEGLGLELALGKSVALDFEGKYNGWLDERLAGEAPGAEQLTGGRAFHFR